MKTRKHRKWYRLNGMLRHGRFEGVVESPYAIYHIGKLGAVTVIATGPCVVLCRGEGIAVSKEVARLTAGISPARLYVVAIHLEDVENVRQQLMTMYQDMNPGYMSYRFGGSVKMTTIHLKLTP